MGRGPRADDDAGGEVLDLALAIDRRIRDDGDGLVKMVRQVRPSRRERRKRAVVPERADRLAGGLRHICDGAEILRLVAERREALLAGDRVIVDLIGRRRHLDTMCRPLASVVGGADEASRVRARTGFARLCGQGPAGREALARAGGGDGVTRMRAHEALTKLPVVEEPPGSVRPLECRMLAGSERPWIGDVALERDESTFAREDVLFVRLDMPERAEPHRVHAEQAQVVEAGEEGGRPLREWTEGRPGVRVGVLHRVGQAADLVHDRWEDELDRLDRIHAETVDEPAQQRVDVLRIAAASHDRHAESARLLAQPADRVDLAVVRERRERLHPREGARRVRGVAVVPERRRRAKAGIAKVGEVRDELAGGAAELVHGRRARETHHRRGRAGLDLDGREVERAITAAAARVGLERELPEARLRGAAAREEGERRRRLVALQDDPDTVGIEDRADRRIGVGGCVGRHEEVRDREVRIDREPVGEPGVREVVRPERARNVDEHARAVSLAVDLAGAVRHAIEPVEHERERARTGTGVLARDRDESAGVPFVAAAHEVLRRSPPFNAPRTKRPPDPGGLRTGFEWYPRD